MYYTIYFETIKYNYILENGSTQFIKMTINLNAMYLQCFYFVLLQNLLDLLLHTISSKCSICSRTLLRAALRSPHSALPARPRRTARRAGIPPIIQFRRLDQDDNAP